MISFKAFVDAIHNAVMNASDSLMDKNEGLLDKYFEERVEDVTDPQTKEVSSTKTLVPRTVSLEYPKTDADGKVEVSIVQVPLITLVPISSSQIEKATISAGFEMEIVDDELQLHFTKGSANSSGGFFKRSKTNSGTIEIVVTPKESTDGLKQIIEGYEAILKRQIS